MIFWPTRMLFRGMSIRKALPLALVCALAACVPATEVAPPPAPVASVNPMVGGATMDPARTIFQNVSASRDHSTLVAALQRAGLSGTLSGANHVTLFAPGNSAFGRLPPTMVDTLMHPSNRTLLAQILGYHVVTGRRTRADIMADIRAGGGTAIYRTQAGATLRARMEGSNIAIWDANNLASRITVADVVQSNGVFHVVDSVLLPPRG
jgi:uncharacterized surface protein with fasciclin (FAS1) repeats